MQWSVQRSVQRWGLPGLFINESLSRGRGVIFSANLPTRYYPFLYCRTWVGAGDGAGVGVAVGAGVGADVGAPQTFTPDSPIWLPVMRKTPSELAAIPLGLPTKE